MENVRYRRFKLGLVVHPATRVASESRFAIFLARILWKMRLVSRENISASLASLTSLARRENAINCEACESHNLRVLQFERLANKQNHKHSEKLVLDPKFSQDFRVKIIKDSRESRYEISVCETRKSCYEICLRDSQKASLAMKFLSARLVRSNSRYEIS